MHLDELTGRRVVLLGAGTDVRAALGAIRAAGPAELVLVDDGDPRDGGDGIDGLRRQPLREAAAGAEVFVRSPGFPRSAAPLVEAVRRGAVMTTPIDLWLGTFGRERVVIGVTGTKGKSTVTSLIGWLAGELGVRVGVAGNVGVPVFDPAWDADAPIVVLEISSYQAADLHHVPDVAVLTFLAEDHLSWHGGRDAYDRDKVRMARNEGGDAGLILVGPSAGRWGEVLASEGLSAEVVEMGGLERRAAAEDGAIPSHRLENAALAAVALERSLALPGRSVSPGVGELGAAGPVREVPADLVVAGARLSLPGRLDPCPGPDGILCIDDALASNPAAVAAGLRWLRGLGRRTVVLLGGYDRDVDPGPLGEEVGRWTSGRLRAVALPLTGSRLAERAGIELIGLADDVAGAVEIALATLDPGDALLFSPGAPTPPEVGTWKDRSDQFRVAVAAMAGRAGAGGGAEPRARRSGATPP